jgi:hypothetical protein
VLQILGSNLIGGSHQTFLFYFYHLFQIRPRWASAQIRSEETRAPRGSSYLSPIVQVISARSSSFILLKENAQSLLNSYLLNYNSFCKVFYMKVYQKNA